MQKLLVATDFSELARQAYSAAASLAKSYDAEIQLVHELEPPPPLYFESMSAPVDLDRYYDRLKTRLDDELQHPSFKDVRVSAHLLRGVAENGNLLDFAQAEQHDLIVMASHGRSGLAHALLGSFAERVARHSSVPVLTYRRQAEGDRPFAPRSILLPFDLSENAKAVFPLVQLLGECYDVEARVLHVFPEVPARGDWGDAQERLRVSAETASRIEEGLRNLFEQELPLFNVTVSSRFGDAYGEIIKDARVMAPDLIVMATHGRTGLQRFYFGSVAEKVLRSSPCSVLTVRPTTIHEESVR